MGSKKSESGHTPVIRFQTDDQVITITFSKEESAGVKATILDILTEAYRDRIQRASPYTKAG